MVQRRERYRCSIFRSKIVIAIFLLPVQYNQQLNRESTPVLGKELKKFLLKWLKTVRNYYVLKEEEMWFLDEYWLRSGGLYLAISPP